MQGIDVIILIIVAVLLLIALYGSIRHFKGEGPCCGGTSSRKSQEKQLMRPVIGRKSLRISGMHCENCADHVARALNTIEGVSANVSLKEGRLRSAMTARSAMRSCGRPWKRPAIMSATSAHKECGSQIRFFSHRLARERFRARAALRKSA